MSRLPENSVLLLVDVQKGFDLPVWGARNNPQAERNMERLLEAWRLADRPVFHVQHHSLESESPLRADLASSDLKEFARPLPDERLFHKHVNSAFIGTDLEQALRDHGYDTLVIVGLTTNHCVSSTARMAGNLGFDTYVVADATAAFDRLDHLGQHHAAEAVHTISLANLHGEFATVLTTDQVLSRL